MVYPMGNMGIVGNGAYTNNGNGNGIFSHPAFNSIGYQPVTGSVQKHWGGTNVTLVGPQGGYAAITPFGQAVAAGPQATAMRFNGIGIVTSYASGTPGGPYYAIQNMFQA